LNDVSGVSEGAKVLSLPGQTLGAFAYQFFIGLDYDINKNWYVGLNYKYLITQSVSYTVTGTDTVTGTPQSGTFETQFSSHLVMLTIGYQF
jgi:opacity protein-like surface antigen